MKKIVLMVLMTVMSVTMSMAATKSPVENVARKAAEVMLTQAVNSGYGTNLEKDKILESGIVEEVTRTLIDTNFDVAKAVDKAADVAVREGWFRNKAAAKKALRQACEYARKNESIVLKVYRILGI